MNATQTPKRGGCDELAIENDPNVQAIVIDHRDEALAMFMADASASRMVALRMKNISAIQSSIAGPSLPSQPSMKLSPSLPSDALRDLLSNSEEEAMRLFQIVIGHRDEALAMFREDAPASRAAALQKENLEAMKSSIAVFTPTLPSALLDHLVKAEEEALMLFQEENVVDSNSSKIVIGDSEQIHEEHVNDSTIASVDDSRCSNYCKIAIGDSEKIHDAGFGGEDANVSDRDEAASKHWSDGNFPAHGTLRSIEVEQNALKVLAANSFNIKDSASKVGKASVGPNSETHGRESESGIVMATKLVTGDGKFEHIRADAELKNSKDDALFQYLKDFRRKGRTCDAKVRHAEKEAVSLFQEEHVADSNCPNSSKIVIDDSEQIRDVELGEADTDNIVRDENDARCRSNGEPSPSPLPPDKESHQALRGSKVEQNGLEVHLQESLAEISLKTTESASKVRAAFVGLHSELKTSETEPGDVMDSELATGDGGIYRSSSDAELQNIKVEQNGLEVDSQQFSAANSSNMEESASKAEKASVGLDSEPQDRETKSGDVTDTKLAAGDELSSADTDLRNCEVDALLQSLKGAQHRQNNGTYAARVYHYEKRFHVGTYKLRSDAALAYDMCNRALRGKGWKGVNFENMQAHRKLRAIELKRTGLVVNLEDNLAAISFWVKKVTLKVRNAAIEGYSDRYQYGDVPTSEDVMDAILANKSELSENSSARAELHKWTDEELFQSLKGFHRARNRYYAASIGHFCKKIHLGTYKLQSDAAFAYDSAARVLKGPKWECNFRNEHAHRTLRAVEMKKKGLDVDLETTLTEISSRVNEVASMAGNVTCNAKDSSGYSITVEALAAIKSIINGAISEICSSEDNISSLDSQEQTEYAKQEVDGENTSSSTALDSKESNDDSENKDGLSDYERLRLREIKRNQAWLIQLGLVADTAICSSSTNLLDSNSRAGTTTSRKKRRTVSSVQRSLPDRCCRAKLKQGFSYSCNGIFIDDLDLKEKVATVTENEEGSLSSE